VLCLNVLEYLDDPGRVVDSLRGTLKAGGNLMVLVPLRSALFGSLDRSLGHKRRYSPADMRRQLLESQGFAVEQVYDFNRVGAPPWWAYSKLFGAGTSTSRC
jgi:SAM-dependent methyltransferase